MSFCLFPSDSPPHPTREGEGVREQMCGSLLQIEAKPQQFLAPNVGPEYNGSFVLNVL